MRVTLVDLSLGLLPFLAKKDNLIIGGSQETLCYTFGSVGFLLLVPDWRQQLSREETFCYDLSVIDFRQQLSRVAFTCVLGPTLDRRFESESYLRAFLFSN